MLIIDSDMKNKIKEILIERNALSPCPRCKNKTFILGDGFLYNSIQTKLDGYQLGGNGIPTIAVICDKCGYVSQHSLGVLGLLNNETEEKKGDNNE